MATHSQCGSVTTMGAAERPRWAKVLYLKQPYPDNYSDDTLLRDMKKNADVEVFEYWSCVRETAAITQELSVVVLFVVMFKHLWDGTLSLRFLLLLDAAMFAVWVVCRPLLAVSSGLADALRSVLSVVVFASILLIMSPVMHSLTLTYSNDTIWALTITLLTVHTLFYDYKYVNAITTKQSGVVSVNAAVFSAVLLGSRLPSALHAFSLLVLAVLLFALSPVARHHLKAHSPNLYLSLTWVLLTVTVVFLLFLFELLCGLYLLTILAITFVCPWVLINMQKSCKLQLKGPWDEAKPPPTPSSEMWRNAT
eukprot:TRINITY_DN57087_c0_g1_i1.p1 TRINITY_DN57087_c0_g1~~TRINITY_DN57087_c0_g1_i1.p1  ORF type:complete len:309 (-),score=62.72 TRINITY_DN57087_c0_g1_i1:147-1073(-)